ncbi:hypothetical protein ACFFK0_04985 [Paenibacillus chartarius]|uniref:Secreted protein n=1 Tax=Paenibacillus chartarius TaxID=747481 RepID=A0ABV6DGP7_9BACL
MNKTIRHLFLLSALGSALLTATACTPKATWDSDSTVVAASRIMADQVDTVWTVKEQGSSAGAQKAFIRLGIKKKDGNPIESFDITHEKLLHLIIVSKDLSYFQHIHPEYKGQGVFEIENEFPSGGEYRLIADFKPTGGDAVTRMEWTRVGGPAAAAPADIVPDQKLERTEQGKRVQLSIDQLAVGADTKLSFRVTDESTGQPVTDLEPYLGAIGHVVVLSEDGETYLHVHAEPDQGSGPDAVFETSFPKPGVYKIWGQFQHAGQVFTVPYVVNVR